MMMIDPTRDPGGSCINNMFVTSFSLCVKVAFTSERNSVFTKVALRLL